ncbi:hypothetical protein P43SY_002869 [Pythium insidiosum]|uniref:Epidermal growth factor-like domain-containing protein n=1 Tax=Pythium insidiosum TaxID=114742 RepID=A0AAD5QAL8_PYTIN|nr:hypothetical protein P43SY_002869 [Pythium insidiosum]KAJ0412071.1 hypothetical protein ATCC90586_004617 [Pythium insidiosum]
MSYDSGTFSVTFGNQTVRGIPFNADINTFKNALLTIPFVGDVDVSFNGVLTICSTDGTFVTIGFRQLWHRNLFGDIPPMTFSRFDVKGAPVLFLNGGDGFIDIESKEVIKGIDSCRVVEQQSVECSATMSCGGASSECSGNGRCLALSDLAPLVTVNGELAGFSYGNDPNDPLTWDRQKIRSCLCDPGFFGFDCSLRECPRGDDPNTYDDTIERQLVQCIATGGTFTLTFRDQTTASIPFNANAAAIKAALEAVVAGLLVDVSIVGGVTACSIANTLIRIDFTSELGSPPALKASRASLRDSVNGNGQDGSGTVVIATGGTALLGQNSIRGTRERAFCSNHGKCDFSTGMCSCDKGWASSNGNGGAGHIGDCGHRLERRGGD